MVQISAIQRKSRASAFKSQIANRNSKINLRPFHKSQNTPQFPAKTRKKPQFPAANARRAPKGTAKMRQKPPKTAIIENLRLQFQNSEIMYSRLETRHLKFATAIVPGIANGHQPSTLNHQLKIGHAWPGES